MKQLHIYFSKDICFIYKNFRIFFIPFSCTVFLFIININIKSMMMMMQWNLRINGILCQWLLYPDTGYVCLFMFAARLAVSCCFRQLNAKHSVPVFIRVLDTTKRLRQAMECGIFILWGTGLEFFVATVVCPFPLLLHCMCEQLPEWGVLIW